MAYQVALAASAQADADRIYEWIVERAPMTGPVWFEKLIESHRCKLAREAEKAKRPIRCLLFGRRGGVHRILFEIDEARHTVWILHIRHGALQDLKLRDLEPDELSGAGPSFG